MDNDYISKNITTCMTDLGKLRKFGVVVDLDTMPVTIIKDKIEYDFQDYINILIVNWRLENDLFR